MYGVLAYFDRETEEKLMGLWEQLVENDISYYSKEYSGKRPHITIADYDELDEGEFKEYMDIYYEQITRIPVNFATLGSFIGSGALLLTPTMSKELLNFHREYHDNFKMFRNNKKSLYLPGKWIPHCTIANRLKKNKLAEALLFCTEKLKPFKGYISEVALIKLKYNGEDCIGVEEIYSKKLI
ncbi:2'-5' RNA ligase family protein [Oceanirhabdus sp. W0125-5]|uniref:2'-5' RNA ligase family protein n=1 Tax=Oceanirhabdus sp. W0125-5 TaxID=2999116 RepID=UPI0022F3456C|nr:2'-5' RNA ligase family protein [Oceanirhabdus sp. W0125-5]WBW97328.1 2'-5' RNA ligase family protein [Oceanirhabdus sp. W0125-5]